MKIFLTGIGGDIAQSIAEILVKEIEDLEIWGADQRPEFARLHFLKGFFQSPKGTDLEYLDWVCSVISKNDFDYFLPIPENEIQILSLDSSEKTRLILSKTKIVWSGIDVVRKFTSKFDTYTFLVGLGLKPPKSHREIPIKGELSFPLIVKPDFGRGSKGLFFCKNYSEITAAMTLTPNPIIQEYIPSSETEYTCGVYRNEDADIRVIIIKRILKDGATGLGEVVENLEIEKQCRLIAESIKLIGSINVQLRVDGDRIAIFEINPRFSSTVGLRHEMGFSDLIWSLGLPNRKEHYSKYDSIGRKFHFKKQFEIFSR